MKRNLRKIQALLLLREAYNDERYSTLDYWDWGYSAKRLGKRIGISRNSASNLLRRLWKQGLLYRKNFKRGTYGKKQRRGIYYMINERGIERLARLY